MPTVPLITVDAFADRPFEGNPAAVVVVDSPPPDATMQAMAAEMNLAETAFVEPSGDGPIGLRWFTPTAEVDLCGHATLAAAHVLWTEHGADGELIFSTLSGPLACRRGDDGAVTMDFPATPPQECRPDDAVMEAAGISAADVLFSGRTRFDEFVRLPDAAAVRRVSPDMRALAAVTQRGLIVTAAGEDPFDFVSRFFAPAVGVDEDPVTGSAHCALAPYWSGVTGRDALTGRQMSARGGTVETRVTGDRVELTGCAVTMLRGELTLDEESA